MTPVRRICTACKVDQTPLGRTLSEMRNARGVGTGLFCEDCHPAAVAHVQAIDRQHGALITPEGTYLCAPRGTPLHTPFPG